MERTRLDDIADRARLAGIADWLFAALVLAMLAFMAGGMRSAMKDAGSPTGPAQWAETTKAPAAVETAAVMRPLPPG